MGKRKLQHILPWLVLLGAYLLSVGFFALYGQHNLDADMSCEMIYADLLNREGRLLTDSWYYSTEIRTVSPVPALQLGLILFESWHAARTFAVAVCLLIVIAAFLYMASKLKLCAGGLYCASILTLPFSQAYAYVTVYGCWYSIYLALVFILLGLVLRLDEDDDWIRRLIILGILGLWGGTAGIRMMMIGAVPMMAASTMEVLPKLMKHEKLADGIKGGHGRRFLGTTIVCVMTAAGYLYNEFVLRGVYEFTDFGGTGIKLRNLDAFFEQVIGIVEFFGFKESSALISARGIGSLAALLIVGLMIWAVVRLWKNSDGICRYVWWFTVSSVALGIVINTLTENGYVRYYLPGLVMLLVLLDYAWSTMPCRNVLVKHIVPLAVVGIFAINAGIYMRQDLNRDKMPYESAAEWLEENGYSQGFATFWNSSMLTEVSDGAITVYAMNDAYWYDDWKQLKVREPLQIKKNLDYVEEQKALYENGSYQAAPENKVFVYLSAMELYEPDIPYAREENLAYRTEHESIFVYESIGALYDTLRQ